MKRFCSLFAVFCLLLSLSACALLPSEEKPSVSVADPTATAPSRTYESETPTEAPAEAPTEATTEEKELFIPGNSFAHVYRTENGTIWTTVIMEFTNVSDSSLFFDYANIDLLGKDSHVFQTIESAVFSPQILAPGETGYYCEVVALDSSEEISLTPKLSDFHGIYPVDKTPVAYEVSNPQLTDSRFGGLVLKATVTNTTETDGDLVCVLAILRNAALEPVGYITGYLDSTLAAGASDKIEFESFMLPAELSAADIAEIELYAYPVADLP